MNGCPDTGAGFSLAPNSAFRRGLASVLTPNWEKKTSVSSARNCSGLIIGWAFSTKTSETTEAADAVVRSDAAAVMVINSPNQSENERKVESPRMAICRCWKARKNVERSNPGMLCSGWRIPFCLLPNDDDAADDTGRDSWIDHNPL